MNGRSESAALGVCVYIYKDTHTLRVLPIHFGRETVPSDPVGRDSDLVICECRVTAHSVCVPYHIKQEHFVDNPKPIGMWEL